MGRSCYPPLAARDLRHRPAQADLLLLAITAATTALTLGLALRGVTSHRTSRPGRRRTGRTSWPTCRSRTGRAGVIAACPGSIGADRQPG